MNTMKTIRIEKITLNIGAGKNERMLDKGEKLFKQLTTVKPVRTKTYKRIQGWGLRPGLPIGVKSTVRGEETLALAEKLLTAKDNELELSYFDDNGNISFGIPEYVDIQGAKYDPEIGIIGFQVCITLKKPGYRIKNRKIRKKKIPTRHRISKEDAMNYFKEQFKTTYKVNS